MSRLTHDVNSIRSKLKAWGMLEKISGEYYFTHDGLLTFELDERSEANTDVLVSWHDGSKRDVQLYGLCLMQLANELLQELASLWERTDPLFPQVAITEAAINLIIHRDYKIDTKAYINIYGDSIEFKNPGTSYVDIDSLIEDPKQRHPPYKRNNPIIQTFSRASLNQTNRIGIKRIQDQLIKCGYKGPKDTNPLHYENDDQSNEFSITLYRMT